MRRSPIRQRGFTLAELVLVIMLVGVMAAALVVFLRPTVDGFVAQRARSELQGAAESALNVLQREVRRALPNSVRSPGGACFQLVPTIAGGRYRKDADVTRAGEAVLDTRQAVSEFDVLGPMNQSRAPVAGDWVVVGNQSVNDVYTDGVNRAAIADPAQAVDPLLGSRRITLTAAQAFPQGYGGGRFFVVPAAEPTLFLVCSGAGISQGQGTGTLYRQVAAFSSAYPAACPAAGGEVLATRVSSCSFQYDPGALAEYGLLQMRLGLTRNGETVSLQLSSMVSNVP